MSRTYTLTPADVGNTLRTNVIATDTASSGEVDSAIGRVIGPLSTVAPRIRGQAKEGARLTTNRGQWNGVTRLRYTYQWQRCNRAGRGCRNIRGATASTYELDEIDGGRRIRVIVYATKNGSGRAASIPSNPTRVIAD